MVTEATRQRHLRFRRVLLPAGLLVALWSVVRVVRLLSGDDSVVTDGDPHGYVMIFSLVLLPVLAVAVLTLAIDTVELWRHGRSARIGPGVALALSAPLAGELVLVAFVLGAAVVSAALIARRPLATPMD